MDTESSEDHVPDGIIYDRPRDPPGQRSVYVPPGNEERESYRLSTFSKFPSEVPVIPRDLAAAGFYYTGYKDRVKCFSCGFCVQNSMVGDDVKHARWHSNLCDFINGRECDNIPIGGGPFSQFILRPHGAETNRPGLREMFPCQHPVNPHMQTETRRLETFDQRWTGNITATALQISRAGFFFLGEKDRVKCWYCNGGLQNWDVDDEPWTEHAKWFPTCEFILQRKGPDFVNRILASFPNLRRPNIGAYDISSQIGLRFENGSRLTSPPPPIIDPQNEFLPAFVINDPDHGLAKWLSQMGMYYCDTLMDSENMLTIHLQCARCCRSYTVNPYNLHTTNCLQLRSGNLIRLNTFKGMLTPPAVSLLEEGFFYRDVWYTIYRRLIAQGDQFQTRDEILNEMRNPFVLKASADLNSEQNSLQDLSLAYDRYKTFLKHNKFESSLAGFGLVYERDNVVKCSSCQKRSLIYGNHDQSCTMQYESSVDSEDFSNTVRAWCHCD